MTRPVNTRALAARAVDLVVSHGRSLDDALGHVLGQAAEPALVREMSYGTLRFYFALSAVVDPYLQKPLKKKDADLRALLLVGAYQLRHMRVAPHAAVNETVAATEALDKGWAKGLVNAVLRAMLRDGPDRWRERVEARVEAHFNHPAWLLAVVQRDWPGDWQPICAANDARAPMTLRVNLRKVSRADYVAKLAASGLAVSDGGGPESAVTLAEPVAVESVPGFAEGEVSVQDAAAQYAGYLLELAPGQRVLDACAAPGGKAAHLLERADVDLLALDRDATRLRRVSENLSRLGLQARTVVGDAAEPSGWWDGKRFDAILLDAPCSGTGVIRRHPDIKLLRRPGDIPRLVATQARILAALWPLLRPGGKLLYATCSILKEENEGQAAAFLAGRRDARALTVAIPGGRTLSAGCQILPGERGMDGFYYAYLEKQ